MTTKTRKKTPLKRPSLPQAGDSLMHQLNELIDDYWVFAVYIIGVSAGVTGLAWLNWFTDYAIGPLWWTLFSVLASAFAIIRVISIRKKVDALRLGIRGERTVGQSLEELRSVGYRVFHDITQEGFNIDHVIIGPGGVFVIETKTISKRENGDPQITYDGQRVLIDGMEPDRDPVVQAQACTDRIGQILSAATGRNPRLRPVVLFPGWFVINSRKDAQVFVTTTNYFLKFLRGVRKVLGPEEVNLFAHALETHVRAAARID